ncbi:unnamed protein product [Calicophoron daubneyi]|uniref:Uncharacterized protein n=1 Tax=Calicophoron daubneyi TaxID=300641 RepID=A0AAV2T780_CALDB
MTHRSTPQDNQNLSGTENALKLPKAAGSSLRGKKASRKKVEMNEERRRNTTKLCRKPDSRPNCGHEYAVGRTKSKPERCVSLRRRRSSRSICSFSTVVSKISLFFGKLMPHPSAHGGVNKGSRRPASAYESKIPPKILIDSFDTLPMNDLLEPNYGYKPETSQLFSFETSNQNTSSVPPDDNENAKKKEDKKKKKKKAKNTPSSPNSLSEVKNALTENATMDSTKPNTKQTTQGDEEPEKDIDEKSSSDVRHIPVSELESFKVGSTKRQDVQKNTAINADSKTDAESKHKHHKHSHQHHQHAHKKDEDEAEVIEDGKNKHHKRAKSSEKEGEARQQDDEGKRNKPHLPLNSEVDTSSEEGVVKKKGVKTASGKHHKSRGGYKSKKRIQGEESVDDSTSDVSLDEKKNSRASKDHKIYETDLYDTVDEGLRRNITRRRGLIPPGSYASRRRRADLYDNEVYDELDRIFDDRMGSRMRYMNDYGGEWYGRRGPSYDECNYSPRNDCRFSKSYSMPTRSERGCCPDACRCTTASSECHSGRVCTCNCECSPPSKRGNSKLGGELLDALNEICSEIDNRRRDDTYICVKQPKPCRTIYTPTVGHCLSPDSYMNENDYSAYFGPPSRHRYASDYSRGLPPRGSRREYDSDTESRERPKRKSSAAPSPTSSQPPQVPVLTPCPIYYPVPTPSCPPAQPSPAPQVNWCTPAMPASQPVGVVVRPTPVPIVVPSQCNPVSTYCPPCVIPSSAPQIVQPANVCLPTATYYQRL